MTTVLALISLLVPAPQEASLPSVTPKPAHMVAKPGTLHIKSDATIVADVASGRVAKLFAADAWKAGAKFKVAAKGKGQISFGVDPRLTQLGEEGYLLKISDQQLRLVAMTPKGLYRGTRTALQVVKEGWDYHQSTGVTFKLGGLYCEDKPRFEWRGMHLDVSRHFFTVAEIKKYLDYIASAKMNVFHWHLLDDGGWRMEVKKYPKLTEVGAWRADLGSVVWDQSKLRFPGKGSGEKLYGGFYTQAQIKDVVRYAAERYITVVPEIEMPGHNLPAMAAYPEIGCDIDTPAGAPYKTNVFCAGKDETMAFIQDVLDETMALFPSKIIHIGGDEVDKSFWSRCPKCKARMETAGLKDYHELQSDFLKRVEKYLNSKGRTLMGWDEILEGGLAPNAEVMSWRGVSGGIAAAKSGHNVVMSPTSHCYFDYAYGGTSTKHVYGYEPIPDELTAEEGKRVRGAQGNVWTEWMEDFARVEYMVYPRMLALAETLWTPADKKDWDDFSKRLEGWYADAVRDGVTFYVEPPKAVANLVVMEGPATVGFERTAIPGIDLRYTTDGSTPQKFSRAYREPILAPFPMTVNAQYFRGGRKVGDPIQVNVISAKPEKLENPQPGFELATYIGKFSKVAEFVELEPTSTRIAYGFKASDVAEEAYAVRIRGWFRAETAGLYDFTIGSDDGSILKIAGAVAISNDALQGYTERTGKAYLPAGWYSVEIDYFEAGGAERLEAFVQGPNDALRGPLLPTLVRG